MDNETERNEGAFVPFNSKTVEYPRLNRADAESVRIFLRKYDNYLLEISACADQIVSSCISTEAFCPVAHKYYVNSD